MGHRASCLHTHRTPIAVFSLPNFLTFSLSSFKVSQYSPSYSGSWKAMLVPSLLKPVVLLCGALFYQWLTRGLLLLACLQIPGAGEVVIDHGCKLQGTNISGLYRDGDIIIGGIFPVHVYRTYHELTYKNPPPPVTCNT